MKGVVPVWRLAVSKSNQIPLPHAYDLERRGTISEYTTGSTPRRGRTVPKKAKQGAEKSLCGERWCLVGGTDGVRMGTRRERTF